MNVLICVFFKAAFGGLHSNVLSTASHCLRKGHGVTVVCPDGPFRSALAAAGIESIATDYSSIDDTVQAILARSERRYDVVHAHPFASRKVALKLGQKLSIPVIVTYHGMYPDEIERHVGEYAAIIAVSEGIRDYLAALVPNHRQKLFVVPNGVNRELFWPVRAMARSGKVKLTFVSRLDTDKRFVMNMLLTALRHCATKHRGQVSWTIVGDGSELDALKTAAEELASAGDFPVRFSGWLNGRALAEAYRQSDVVVAPGRCALEAMACGRSVIAIGSKEYVGLITRESWLAGVYSNFGGFGQGIQGYQEGTIERELSAVVADGALRGTLGNLGMALTRNFYDDTAINERIAALYDTCVAAKSA